METAVYKSPRFYIYPVRILVTSKDRPVTINVNLPANLTSITGISAVHSAGINLYSAIDASGLAHLPNGSIGWLYLECNNRSQPVGNLDVLFHRNVTARHEYGFTSVNILLQKNAIITGVYSNTFDPDAYLLSNTFTPVKEWINYIVTIYLKCTKDHD